MTTNKRPKKILKIARLVFVLPDDFNGDLKKAMENLAEYLSKYMNGSEYDDEEKNRFAMEYGIFEVDEDDNYKLMI